MDNQDKKCLVHFLSLDPVMQLASFRTSRTSPYLAFWELDSALHGKNTYK